MERRRNSRILKVFAICMAILLAFMVSIGWLGAWSYGRSHQAPVQFGVSFSDDYARSLGLDPHQTLSALLDDLGVRRFRLNSYWSDIESSRGTYDFTELDWEMDQIARHGGTISLSLGLRQPRWPECHQPDWAKGLSDQQFWAQLQQFEKAVVLHVRSSSALSSYQLENEGRNSFGWCQHKLSNQEMTREYRLVRAQDPKHPVVFTVSDDVGLPVSGPVGQGIGFSIYRQIPGPVISQFHSLVPPGWYRARAWLISAVYHVPVFDSELQAEPWGNRPIQFMTDSEQAKLMDAARLKSMIDYARRTDLSPADLWGAEWWYWRKTKLQDGTLWEAARQAFLQ